MTAKPSGTELGGSSPSDADDAGNLHSPLLLGCDGEFWVGDGPHSKISEARRTSIAGQKGKFCSADSFYKPIRADTTETKFYTELLKDELAKLSSFVPQYYGTETRENQNFIVLENVLRHYEKPALMDVKISLPSNQDPEDLPRESVGNLLRCYVHGVECGRLVFRNRVNEYQGKNVSIDHFDSVLRRFFRSMGPRRDLIDRLHSIIKAIEEDAIGYRFVSSSLFFVFEQQQQQQQQMPADNNASRKEKGKCDSNDADDDGCCVGGEEENGNRANLFLIDFERITKVEECTPDERVLRAMRYVLLAMRTEWGEKVPIVYLVRHGERHDYTDVNWAPKASHPHDPHLSAAGTQQALDLVDRLCVARPHLIVSSPFQRAVMFAEPLAKRLGCKIAVEPGVCEFLCNKTRKRLPKFVRDEVSLSPWVLDKSENDESDVDEYAPVWKELYLESWDDVFHRTRVTLGALLRRCEGKGDLVVISHRSTLQTIVAALMPECDFDTKLEYGAMGMFYKDLDGQWAVLSFNEMDYLRHRIKSPSSNPWRHIEGYYEDLDWSCYKSTSQMHQGTFGPSQSSCPPQEVATDKPDDTAHQPSHQ